MPPDTRRRLRTCMSVKTRCRLISPSLLIFFIYTLQLDRFEMIMVPIASDPLKVLIVIGWYIKCHKPKVGLYPGWLQQKSHTRTCA